MGSEDLANPKSCRKRYSDDEDLYRERSKSQGGKTLIDIVIATGMDPETGLERQDIGADQEPPIPGAADQDRDLEIAQMM